MGPKRPRTVVLQSKGKTELAVREPSDSSEGISETTDIFAVKTPPPDEVSLGISGKEASCEIIQEGRVAGRNASQSSLAVSAIFSNSPISTLTQIAAECPIDAPSQANGQGPR